LIVLINMLIAMMSNSFQEIMVRSWYRIWGNLIIRPLEYLFEILWFYVNSRSETARITNDKQLCLTDIKCAGKQRFWLVASLWGSISHWFGDDALGGLWRALRLTETTK
jgi:hypothetical protein